MANFIHHIGLQIIEKDIQSFYIEVFGCAILRTFTLSGEEAFSIFNLKKEVKIVYTQCENIELELFVDDNLKNPTFNHVCIHSDRVTEIINNAEKKGYSVHIREKQDKTKTYFVCDSNNNIFEIKSK